MTNRACLKCFKNGKICCSKECIDQKTPISLKYINCLVLPPLQNQSKSPKNRLFTLSQDVLDIVFSYIFNSKDQKKIVLEEIEDLLNINKYDEISAFYYLTYGDIKGRDKRRKKDWYYIYTSMIGKMLVYVYCLDCKSEDCEKVPIGSHFCYKCIEEYKNEEREDAKARKKELSEELRMEFSRYY
jgi:hypothetical protein